MKLQLESRLVREYIAGYEAGLWMCLNLEPWHGQISVTSFFGTMGYDNVKLNPTFYEGLKRGLETCDVECLRMPSGLLRFRTTGNNLCNYALESVGAWSKELPSPFPVTLPPPIT